MDGASKPTAPAVKIFNLSVGDPAQLFLRSMSPLARLLDWLAWKYDLLFVVSAGNHSNAEIRIPASTPEPAIESAVLRALQTNVRNRRLLAPAETVNGSASPNHRIMASHGIASWHHRAVNAASFGSATISNGMEPSVSAPDFSSRTRTFNVYLPTDSALGRVMTCTVKKS